MRFGGLISMISRVQRITASKKQLSADDGRQRLPNTERHAEDVSEMRANLRLPRWIQWGALLVRRAAADRAD
jgi:hypothetical protein